MTNFIDDLIKYIDAQFIATPRLTEKPKGYYAFQHGVIPETKSYYVVQILGDNDNLEDYNDVVSTSIDLQITLYGAKTSENTAIKNTMVIADCCEDFLTNYKKNSDKVVSMRKVMRTTPYTFFDGSKSYTVALRYNVELKLPYVSA